MNSDYRIGKDVDGCDHDLQILYRNVPGGTEESHENPQTGLLPDRDSNRERTEYIVQATSVTVSGCSFGATGVAEAAIELQWSS